MEWIETNDDDLPEDSGTFVIGMWANKRWSQVRYDADFGWLDSNGRLTSPPVYWSYIPLPQQLAPPIHEQTDAEYLRDLSERLFTAASPITDQGDCDKLNEIAAKLADDAGE
jgi:hypothetical protein